MYDDVVIDSCPGGETGRRTGLKIPGPERGVTVRFRPRAPVNFGRLRHSLQLLRYTSKLRPERGVTIRFRRLNPAVCLLISSPSRPRNGLVEQRSSKARGSV